MSTPYKQVERFLAYTALRIIQPLLINKAHNDKNNTLAENISLGSGEGLQR